jgi:L-methionine (R)-S-oxide reductase
MFQTARPDPALPKAEAYRDLLSQAEGLFHGETDAIANAANLSALIYHGLPELNWAGFYLLRGEGELVLGPFQGKPACIRIPLGRGVCGTAAERRETVLVADVHAFPGHIACDAASRSELVVPLVRDGPHGERELLGVLDLDSPLPNRFDAEDQAGIEALAALWVAASAA